MMRISVVCPVYDTDPDQLRAAARSVLDIDSAAVVELILVDDRSERADTLAVLRALAAEPRVVLLTSLRNEGTSGARNRGIAAATAEWIGFLDADDLWQPHWPDLAEAALHLAPDAAWICGNHAMLDRDDRLIPNVDIGDRYDSARLDDTLTCFHGAGFTRFLIGNHWLHIGACLIRRELLARLGGFFGSHVYGEDWLMVVRLSTQAALYHVVGIVYTLRRQTESMTTSPHRLTRARIASHLQARRDPLLAPFRRELRWAIYGAYKGLAANNLLAGHRLRALRFALRAFLLDPREIGDALIFARIALTPAHKDRLATYSSIELDKGCDQ